MLGADARKVSTYITYENSRKWRIYCWAREQDRKYWQTLNVFQAFMHWFFKTLRGYTRAKVGWSSLCTTEKILLGRLKGDGYHGCGIYQKPMKPSRYGIG